MLPGQGYWLATFYFDEDAQLGTTDPAVPESIVPVLGWRYCPQCNGGAPIVKHGNRQVYSAAIIDGDQDGEAQGTDFQVAFHSNETAVDSVPANICEDARRRLAWAAAQYEKNVGRSDGSLERAEEINRLWMTRAVDPPPKIRSPQVY